MDVTPEKLPVHVLGMFTDRMADKITDRLYAKCLVLDDGKERLAIVVVDSCMMPRDLLDRAKELAREKSGLRTDRMMISATHTHSAPSAMGGLGTPPDEEYVKFLPGRIAEGIARAVQNLAPARIGWAVVQDYEHTHCRRWIRRPDALVQDPFGEFTGRAHMHPGYQNPESIGPSGPVDPDLSVVSVQSPEGRPIALLANYSMHYYDSVPISADYFGRFAEKIARLIGVDPQAAESPSAVPSPLNGERVRVRGEVDPARAPTPSPPFVAMMSQGTSGDQMWMDYGAPKKDPGLDKYSEEVAQVAFKAYQSIQYLDWVPLKMAEAKLTLGFRLCDEKRLAWAKKLVAAMQGRLPKTLPEVYAYEQVYLHARPTAELKLQAIRIGDLGIATFPNEVYAITGLKLKAQSPLQPTFNIELANGAEGYIPPPEQHKLGGYTTWAARTAGLEVDAEPRITETLLRLLEEVSGRQRCKLVERRSDYAKAVLASKPAAYWRLSEFNAPVARDSSGHKVPATYEGGVALHLEGPQSPALCGGAGINRSAHLAGGRLIATLPRLGDRYSAEFWFWNGLPNHFRDVTGWLFGRGDESAGERLGITGTNARPGRLFVRTGGDLRLTAVGPTEILPRTWQHVVLVRDGDRLAVYLNGRPEVSGAAVPSPRSRSSQVCFGSGNDPAGPTFEGKLDEIAIYARALEPRTIAQHYAKAGLATAARPSAMRNREEKATR
jgi:hypothetical protein